MTAILGGGEHRYRVVENRAKLPDGWELKDDAPRMRTSAGTGSGAQITLPFASASISPSPNPSTSRNTAWVCCPSSGGAVS